jgi:hypothetical protein
MQLSAQILRQFYQKSNNIVKNRLIGMVLDVTFAF